MSDISIRAVGRRGGVMWRIVMGAKERALESQRVADDKRRVRACIGVGKLDRVEPNGREGASYWRIRTERGERGEVRAVDARPPPMLSVGTPWRPLLVDARGEVGDETVLGRSSGCRGGARHRCTASSRRAIIVVVTVYRVVDRQRTCQFANRGITKYHVVWFIVPRRRRAQAK